MNRKHCEAQRAQNPTSGTPTVINYPLNYYAGNNFYNDKTLHLIYSQLNGLNGEHTNTDDVEKKMSKRPEIGKKKREPTKPVSAKDRSNVNKIEEGGLRKNELENLPKLEDKYNLDEILMDDDKFFNFFVKQKQVVGPNDHRGFLCGNFTCNIKTHFHLIKKKAPLQGAERRKLEKNKVLTCKMTQLQMCLLDWKTCKSRGSPDHYHIDRSTKDKVDPTDFAACTTTEPTTAPVIQPSEPVIKTARDVCNPEQLENTLNNIVPPKGEDLSPVVIIRDDSSSVSSLSTNSAPSVANSLSSGFNTLTDITYISSSSSSLSCDDLVYSDSGNESDSTIESDDGSSEHVEGDLPARFSDDESDGTIGASEITFGEFTNYTGNHTLNDGRLSFGDFDLDESDQKSASSRNSLEILKFATKRVQIGINLTGNVPPLQGRTWQQWYHQLGLQLRLWLMHGKPEFDLGKTSLCLERFRDLQSHEVYKKNRFFSFFGFVKPLTLTHNVTQDLMQHTYTHTETVNIFPWLADKVLAAMGNLAVASFQTDDDMIKTTIIRVAWEIHRIDESFYSHQHVEITTNTEIYLINQLVAIFQRRKTSNPLLSSQSHAVSKHMRPYVGLNFR